MSVAPISQYPNPFSDFLPDISQISVPVEVARFFSQGYSWLPAGEFWQTKVVTPLGHFLPSVPDYLMGGMWGSLILVNGCNMYLDTTKYAKALKEGCPIGDLNFRLNKIWYKAIKDLVYFVGAIGHLGQWADRVKWINIGSFAPFLKSLGYGSTLVASGVEIFSRTQDLRSIQDHMEKNNSDIKKERMKEHQRHCWLEIAANVSMLAWASLGVLGLVINSPVVSTLFLVTLAVSVPFFFLSFCYKKNLDFLHEKELSKKCCEIYA